MTTISINRKKHTIGERLSLPFSFIYLFIFLAHQYFLFWLSIQLIISIWHKLPAAWRVQNWYEENEWEVWVFPWILSLKENRYFTISFVINDRCLLLFFFFLLSNVFHIMFASFYRYNGLLRVKYFDIYHVFLRKDFHSLRKSDSSKNIWWI